MTPNDIIKSVKQNLGNRSSGVIGGTPVDTVVLDAFNKGFTNIIKQANPDYYNRTMSLTLTTAAYVYDVPTTDSSGNTDLKVKQITGARLVLAGETAAYHIQQITYQNFLNYRLPDAQTTGVPSTFAFYNNKLYFIRYPDSTYTLTLAVNILPTNIAVGIINNPLNVEDVWSDVIEAYATFYCFAKLQQMSDAATWETIYQERKREAKSVIYKQPMQSKPNVGGGYFSSDPLTDPFVRRFN